MRKHVAIIILAIFLTFTNKFAISAVSNKDVESRRQKHDWIFSGDVQPAHSIVQMLDNFSPPDETFFIGIVECIHLKSYFEVWLKMTADLENLFTQPEDKQRLKRFSKTIDDLDHSLGLSDANNYAMQRLLQGRPSEDHVKKDFFSKGVLRYIDSEDLGLTSWSDKAIMKKNLALDDLKACVYSEKQLERLLTSD